jgi:hypothetical protein
MQHRSVPFGSMLRCQERPPVFLEPIATIREFRELDEGEVMCGYMDGFQGITCEASALTRSYLHGWRNGAVDSGLMEPDAAYIELEAEFMDVREP